MTGKLPEALSYAVKLHEGHYRKGTSIPYISHLLGVASIVLDYGGDEDQAAAALLHDAVEDQGGLSTLRKIEERFDKRVADMVFGCSESPTHPEPPWRVRKEAFLKSIPDKSWDTVFVSMADKLHNVRSILMDYRQSGEKVWERFNGKRDGTLWYYSELVRAFTLHGDSPLLKELKRSVKKLEKITAREPLTFRGQPPSESR